MRRGRREHGSIREEEEKRAMGEEQRGWDASLISHSYPYCIWARLTQLQMLDGTPVCHILISYFHFVICFILFYFKYSL